MPVFGPTRAAAEIEWSKSYAKSLMESAGIATSEGKMFHDAWEARDFARLVFASGLECVVKAGFGFGDVNACLVFRRWHARA